MCVGWFGVDSFGNCRCLFHSLSKRVISNRHSQDDTGPSIVRRVSEFIVVSDVYFFSHRSHAISVGYPPWPFTRPLSSPYSTITSVVQMPNSA